MLRFFSAKDAGDAAYDAAQRDDTFLVSEEYFSGFAAAVVPVTQEGKMLHQLQGRSRSRLVLGVFLYLKGLLNARFHGVRLPGLLSEREINGISNASRLNMEKGD